MNATSCIGRFHLSVDPDRTDFTCIPMSATTHTVTIDMSIVQHGCEPPCTIEHDRTRIPIGCRIMANFIA